MIIAYHSVSDDLNDFWSTSPDQFRDDMAYLRDKGYECMSLMQYYAGVFDDKSIVLTFDDGYANFIDNALPILNNYGFSATVFIVVGKMGMDSDWRSDKLRIPLMDWQDVEYVHANGFEIGSHTMTHPYLTRINQAEAWTEIHDSKTMIEERIGCAVKSFAYPYCSYNLSVVGVAGSVGYNYAVGGGEGNSNHLTLRRTGIHRSDKIKEIL